MLPRLLPFEERPYRPCVGLLLLNPEGRIFVAQRIDQTAEAWQLPQGGIDEGETPRQAALRELAEEIGTDKAEILAESREWLPYDLPPALADKVWGGRFRGQTQRWFALRFTGTDADIDLNTAHPEFREWRWASPADALRLAVVFKRDIYRRILEEFAHLVR